MANYIYLVIDPATKTATAIDPSWDIQGVFKYAEKLGAKVTTAVYTHRHFDHTGGTLPKAMTRGRSITLEGVADCLAHGAGVYLGVDDLEVKER